MQNNEGILPVRTLTILLGLFLGGLCSAGVDRDPKINCFDNNYSFDLLQREGGNYLRVSSLKSQPLLPSFDRRIRDLTIGPLECAQLSQGATMCYSKVCLSVTAYDFDGKEIKDLEFPGAPLFTALPESGYKPDYFSGLKLRLEFQDISTGAKHSVENLFQTYPGQYCKF